MPNKYEKVAEAGKIIPNIFANISAGIEAGKKPAKPLDKYFEDMDNINDKFFKAIDGVKRKKSLDPYIKTLVDKIKVLESLVEELKAEKFQLVEDEFKAIDMFRELKAICTKDQLARLAYVMKRIKEEEK